MAASKIIKPPLYLFILHVILFVVSILFFINFMSLNSYMYLSITAHLVGFVCLLIFLTVDKSISKSRNYSQTYCFNIKNFIIYLHTFWGIFVMGNWIRFGL